MKSSLLLIFALIISISGFSQEKFSRIFIEAQHFNAGIIAKAGIAVEDAFYDKSSGFYLELSDNELTRLKNTGIQYKTIVEDVRSWYAERNFNVTTPDNAMQQSDETDNIPVPAGFSLGSMGGYCTLTELYAHLDTMAARFPNLITTKEQVASYSTHEGRPVYWVRISDHPNTNEDEPEVLFTGLTHAREPIGMQQLLFFMYHILENYETDSNIHKLLDTTEIYVIPCVNPDGYEYNHTTDPNGGGMFRKNRRDNSDGSYGVDLNRNYGFKWGYDDIGSSPYTVEETYRGPSAFSEPETQMVRDFCMAHQIKITLNYHGYGNWFLYPWGYITDTTPDNPVFYTYGETMTAENNYVFGTASATLYNTNGDANDWMYGDQTSKPKIFSFVPEVGSGNDGFWPASNRIIPLCQENVLANFLTCYYAGWYGQANDESNLVVDDISGYLKFRFKRLGLKENATYTVSVIPLDDSFLSTGNPKVFVNPGLVETIHDSIAYTLKPDLPQGFELKYILKVDDGIFVRMDTVSKIYGQPVEIFADNCNTKTNWTSDKWDVSTLTFHSPTGSITDSKTGNYSTNANTSVTLVQDIDLTTNVDAAVLSFYTKYAIEKGYDYVQVKASKNGTIWTALEGKYTHKGNSNQLAGKPLYDGTQTTWVYEELNLSAFAGSKIKLRFTLKADAGVNLDGFYFDDLKVSVFDNTTGVENNPANPVQVNVYPNPAKDIVRIVVQNAGYKIKGTVSICDVQGRQVRSSLIDNQTVIIQDVSSLLPGIYLLKVELAGQPQVVKKLMIE